MHALGNIFYSRSEPRRIAFSKAKENPNLLNWLPKKVKKWYKYLIENGAAKGTANNHLKSIRAFFMVNNLD